jgi:predicted RNA binding protein YcfA (HicA-like mRNA interferase family)
MPRHASDIKRSLLRKIVKDAGLTVEQFLDLL